LMIRTRHSVTFVVWLQDRRTSFTLLNFQLFGAGHQVMVLIFNSCGCLLFSIFFNLVLWGYALYVSRRFAQHTTMQEKCLVDWLRVADIFQLYK